MVFNFKSMGRMPNFICIYFYNNNKISTNLLNSAHFGDIHDTVALWKGDSGFAN